MKRIAAGLYEGHGFQLEKFQGEWRLYYPDGHISIWPTKRQAVQCLHAELKAKGE